MPLTTTAAAQIARLRQCRRHARGHASPTEPHGLGGRARCPASGRGGASTAIARPGRAAAAVLAVPRRRRSLCRAPLSEPTAGARSRACDGDNCPAQGSTGLRAALWRPAPIRGIGIAGWDRDQAAVEPANVYGYSLSVECHSRESRSSACKKRGETVNVHVPAANDDTHSPPISSAFMPRAAARPRQPVGSTTSFMRDAKKRMPSTNPRHWR